MQNLEIKVEGMHCDGCVKSVTRVLGALPGVSKVEVLLAEGKARLSYDASKSGPSDFKRAIEGAGFKAP
jgi:copper chaperone